MDKDRRAAIIAAAVTFGVALVILVLLFVLTVGSDRSLLAQESMPEIQDDEEVFLEPELLVMDDPGDELSEKEDAAAPQTPGEPDPAEEEQPVRVVKNLEELKEEPVSNKPKLVSDTKSQSDLKTSTPKLTAEEEKRIAAMQGKLKSDNNGSHTGSESGVSGSGGFGISTTGSVSGRKMLSCPSWKLKLSQKTTVRVRITVDADGNVTGATAEAGNGSPNLRSQCEKMARGSKWTPKPGAAPANGIITFTITPA